MSSSAAPLAHPRVRAITNRLLVLEAIGGLFAAWLQIRLLLFSRVVAPGRQRLIEGKIVDVRRLARAVEIGRRKVPWRALCFESALALRMMLRRRGISSVLHYGIGSEAAGTLKAHVWLSVDGEVLIGGETAEQFACVGDFPSGPAD